MSQEINSQSLKVYISIIIDIDDGESYYIVGAFKDIKTAIKNTIIELVNGSHIYANLDKKKFLKKDDDNKDILIKNSKNNEEFIEYMYSKYAWNKDYQCNLDELCETFGTHYDEMWRVDIIEKDLI